MESFCISRIEPEQLGTSRLSPDLSQICRGLDEVPLIKEHFARFGTHLPEGLNAEVKALEEQLRAAK
jgi:hypothetical protein